jgi:hypothetical protein
MEFETVVATLNSLLRKNNPRGLIAHGSGETPQAVIDSFRKTFVGNTVESTGTGLPTH